MSEKKRKRYHNFMLVQQPQYLAPPYDSLEKLISRAEEIDAESYAGILHDKDEGKAEHIHLFIHFRNAREVKSVAKKFNIAPERLQIWDESIENAYAYLTHRTRKAQNDFQYAPNEVIASFDYGDWLGQYEAKQKCSKPSANSNQINFLLDCLYVGAITREEVEKRLTGSEYAKSHKKIEDVWAKRLQNIAEERMKQRKAEGQQVEVIWIYGEAGTGKTRFAKKQAAKRNTPYYITGSSRDPFQRYNGEDVIIYDEARPSDIHFSDLLKLLDPYGEDVSAPSRYYDKAICAAVYFITSPYSPLEFYKEIMGEDWETQKDGFDQLLRRLSLVLHMTKENIEAVEFCLVMKNFQPIAGANRTNPYYQPPEKQQDNKVEKFNALFDDIHSTDSEE